MFFRRSKAPKTPAEPPRSAAPERQQVVERLRRMVQRWPQVSGCQLNPDPVVVEGIVQGLVRSNITYGVPYCPCRDLTGDAEADRANICPCRWHTDEIARDLHCRCQLFVGEGYDPVVAYASEQVEVAAGADEHVVERRLTVYVTSWCFHSRRIGTFLKEQGVPYTAIDIEQNPSAAQQVEGWNRGYRSVPTLILQQTLSCPTPDEMQRVLLDSGAALIDATLYVAEDEPAGDDVADANGPAAWLQRQALAHALVALPAGRLPSWRQGPTTLPALDVTLRLTEPTTAQLVAALGMQS